MKNRDGSVPNDNWQTPKWLYDKLNDEFEFDFDPCPYSELPITPETDGLLKDWGNSNFINPPYNRVDKPKFIQKAYNEWMKGKTCVLLIPVSTSTIQFHQLIMPNAEIRFLKGRVAFSGYNDKGIFTDKNKGKHDSMIVIFRSKKSLCHTLFTRDDVKDYNGCLRESGHQGEHVFKSVSGQLIAWDYDWDCGCKYCQTENFDDMCIVYRDINDINQIG